MRARVCACVHVCTAGLFFPPRCVCACTVAICIRSCLHSASLGAFVLEAVWLHVRARVCVCLTIFISVFSSGADPPSHHLDVFAAGPAVELVNAMVSPAHGVSHLRLVFYVHAEVDPIHAEYLLGIRRARGGRS